MVFFGLKACRVLPPVAVAKPPYLKIDLKKPQHYCNEILDVIQAEFSKFWGT